MRRKIILLAAALMMFMGVVSASSINGDYKGNPIVKVMSNGKQLQSDEVPAMIYDGHTVVPISLLRQLGASVEWNQDNYSVDVKLPQNNGASPDSKPSASIPTNDIKTLKLYSKIADHYKRLEELGDSLYNLGSSFSITATSISDKRETSAVDLDRSNKKTNDAFNRYDQMLTITDNLIVEAEKSNVIIYDMADILKKYYSSIGYYKIAADNLNWFYSSRSNANNSAIYDNLQKGDNIVSQGILDAMNKYQEYYRKTQGF